MCCPLAGLGSQTTWRKERSSANSWGTILIITFCDHSLFLQYLHIFSLSLELAQFSWIPCAYHLSLCVISVMSWSSRSIGLLDFYSLVVSYITENILYRMVPALFFRKLRNDSSMLSIIDLKLVVVRINLLDWCTYNWPCYFQYKDWIEMFAFWSPCKLRLTFAPASKALWVYQRHLKL